MANMPPFLKKKIGAKAAASESSSESESEESMSASSESESESESPSAPPMAKKGAKPNPLKQWAKSKM